MKRIAYIGVIVFLALTVILVTACGELPNSNNNSNQTQEDKAIYDKLATLAHHEYNSLVLSVTMNEGAKVLSGTYTVTKLEDIVSVEYSYQQYATFQEIDGELVAPETEIETFSGELTSKNGKVTDQSGAELNIPVDTVTAKGFAFNKSYFKNVTSSSTRFDATVTNPKAFVGIDNVTDMTVSVDYSQTTISQIVVRYSIETRIFVLSYTFD